MDNLLKKGLLSSLCVSFMHEGEKAPHLDALLFLKQCMDRDNKKVWAEIGTSYKYDKIDVGME